MYRFLFFLFAFRSTALFAQFPPALPPNQLMVEGSGFTVRFEWLGDSLAGPHAALLLPIRLAGEHSTVYLQFDTGAPTSVLYRQALAGTSLATLPDSSGYLHYVHLEIGKTTLLAREIRLIDAGAATTSDKKIIGTIGLDLLENHVVLLDYPHRKLFVGIHLPKKWQKIPAHSFVFSRYGILLPAVLEGIVQQLYFDSGSSAFPLLTDSTTCTHLAGPNPEWNSFAVGSWGNRLTAHSATTKVTITVAGQVLPIGRVTWIEGASQQQIQQMQQLGISGMTGNELFRNGVLILDAQRQQFGLIEN